MLCISPHSNFGFMGIMPHYIIIIVAVRMKSQEKRVQILFGKQTRQCFSHQRSGVEGFGQGVGVTAYLNQQASGG